MSEAFGSNVVSSGYCFRMCVIVVDRGRGRVWSLIVRREQADAVESIND